MPHALNRRAFLGLLGTVSGVAALSACSSTTRPTSTTPPLITPSDAAVTAREAERAATGITRKAALSAAPAQIDLGGRIVSTWAYNGQLTGPLIGGNVGDRLQAELTNNLTDPSSVHWHGLALRNDMDGVPGLTQSPVAPGTTFRYDFVLPDAGTYWYHSHDGTQLDRGLYGPLVIRDPHEPGVDVDEVVVIDDWLDGISGTPDQQLKTLQSMSGTSMSMKSALLGGDVGDVMYPLHLINGRPPTDRWTVTASTGGRVRLRLINAGSDTAYRVAVAGHRLTVTATDGRALQPVDVDAVLIGMGERYDVEFIAASGVWPIYAAAEGKNGAAAALLRTTDAVATAAPDPTAVPPELTRQVLGYTQLRPGDGATLTARTPDRTFAVTLDGTMDGYRWSLGGDADKLLVRSGERVRITMKNTSSMWHPMHLHGHTFALPGAAGVRKDTVRVLPGQTVAIDFDADNPGRWMYHCHNVYHQASGMQTSLGYLR